MSISHNSIILAEVLYLKIRNQGRGSCAKAQLQDKHYGGCCGLRKVLNYSHPEKE